MTRLAVLFAALLLTLAGCGGNGGSKPRSEASSASASSSSTAASAKPEVAVPKGPPPRRLVVRDLKRGSGRAAAGGDTVTVHYVGVRYKDGKQFDASWDRGKPFPFVLEAQEVIPGWDRGVKGMKVGGRRELVIPPKLAYGAQGSPPDIPANATLVFVIDLLRVE